ncbi:hypothetical protein J3A83DRAFT_4370348 [Scleroderma citrinum]
MIFLDDPTIYLQSQHFSLEDHHQAALSPSPNHSSPHLSINKFIGYVWVFTNFKSWSALRWDLECIGMKVLRRILGQEVIDAMKTQAEMVLLAHEMCGLSLLISFDTFLDQTWGFLALQDAPSAKGTLTWVDIHTPLLIPVPSFSPSSADSPSSDSNSGLNSGLGPGVPGNPTSDNLIPTCALHELSYVWMALAMMDEIAALTGDTRGPWACVFMAIKDDLENRHLYNATGSLWPIPNEAFHPTPTTPVLRYYLLATGAMSATTSGIGDGSTMSKDLTGSPECQPVTFHNNQRLVDWAWPGAMAKLTLANIKSAYGQLRKIGALYKMHSLFQHCIKGNANPVDEANKLIECTEHLTAAGFPVDEKILAMAILMALPPDWENIISLITTTMEDANFKPSGVPEIDIPEELYEDSVNPLTAEDYDYDDGPMAMCESSTSKPPYKITQSLLDPIPEYIGEESEGISDEDLYYLVQQVLPKDIMCPKSSSYKPFNQDYHDHVPAFQLKLGVTVLDMRRKL